MKILAFDTCTEVCTAALWVDGEVVDDHRLAPRQHGELILPMLQQLLDVAGLKLTDLDAVACGRGPGSFTGVRLCIGIAQGVAMGADLGVIPISTLACIAHGQLSAMRDCAVLVATDARMAEIYWGAYQFCDEQLLALAQECVVSPASAPALPHANTQWRGAGTGWDSYVDTLKQRYADQIIDYNAQALPRGSDLAALAVQAFSPEALIDPVELSAVYLRNQVI